MTLLTVLILCFIIGVPIGFSLGIAGTFGIMQLGAPLMVVVQRMYSGIDSIPLIAVLLFTLAGALMLKGGIATRLVHFSDTLVGHMPGGMAMVTVVGSMFFGLITGSAIAATAAIGSIMLPVMIQKGYHKSFAACLCSTSGSIGPILPPSIPLLVFGVIANTSIARLFLGGVIPGILMGIALMILSYILGKKRGYIGREKRATRREIFNAFKDAIWALIMPFFIMGGILSGAFTPTESAAVAVAYAILVSVFIYKELTLRLFVESLFEASKTTGTVLIVVGFASVFTWVITMMMIPQTIAAFLADTIQSRFMMLLLINIILLIVGTSIDTISCIVIFAPLFLTLAPAFDIDVVHLGVLMAVNLTIGMCTPPLGVCLFVSSNISGIPLTEMFKDLWQQIIALLIVLIIITYMPWTVTWLPNLLIG